MALEKNLRWFGPDDPVTLSEIRQTGVQGIVTALHHIPNGRVWEKSEIQHRKAIIEQHGLYWHVVESLPVTNEIKAATSDRDIVIENYIQSMRNLAECGIDTICYNFMPVLDWARTDLNFRTESGSESMLFDYPTFAAFDIYILGRPKAEKDYPASIVKLAEDVFKNMDKEEAEKLAYNIIVVTQGFIDGGIGDNYTDYKTRFLEYIQSYSHIDKQDLRNNLGYFLDKVIPVADETGINMAIHADDPAFPLLGLPRIVSTSEDMDWIFNRQKSIRNGLTFCSGSFSTNRDNNLVRMVNQLADRIHFAHLRNTQFLDNKSFYESGHLEGSIDMYSILKTLVNEQKKRINSGRRDHLLPIRPDHGIKILDDFNRRAHPGYPLIGRMKGLAELSGLEAGVTRE